ncbi:MAG: O-Antigen ligase, partial [Actinomycetota bacterium]|nr:O-Antigen ligase [Actinomycetota bacterium]
MLEPVTRRARPTGGALALLLLSAVAGYLCIRLPPVAAALVVGAPLMLYAVARPWVAAPVGVALVPVLHSLLGSEGGSVVVSPSDATLLLVALGLFPLFLLVPEWRNRLAALRPMVLFAAPWLAWLLVILAAHVSARVAFKTLTAAEVTVLPMLLGACVLSRRSASWALKGYLLAAGGLAVLWIAGGSSSFAGNKNAAGQHLAMALLLVVVFARGKLRGLIPVPLFLVGLLFASSRGAIVGAAFGGIALLALRGLGSWRRTAITTAALSLIVLIGYNAVPAKVQARVQAILSAQSSVSTSDSEIQQSTDYNLAIRKAYRTDALRIIGQHPVLGVGTGNYHAGTGPTVSIDPHNVFLRTAAEGGFPDAAGFVFLLGGTGLLLVRRLGTNPWAGPAIALQVATITHAIV